MLDLLERLVSRLRRLDLGSGDADEVFLRLLGSYLGNDLRRLRSRRLLWLRLRLRLPLELLCRRPAVAPGLRLSRGSSRRARGLTMSARLSLL